MHRSRRPLVLAAAAAAAFAGTTGPLLAEDTADPVDPVEEKALREEAQARFDEALATFRQAFDACVREAKAGKPGEAVRERNLARAEAVLEKIDSLTERVTKHGETEKFLAAYDAEALGPVLESAVRYERAIDVLAQGDREAALKLVEPLGMARHFWILGPFDNERGRGFSASKNPKSPEAEVEKKIDLAGAYKGKEREVSWREVQVDQTLGYVDLDAMLRPNDQCAAYAVAFVKSAADVDAAIRLGSDEATRVWWNGLEVVSRDVRRQMGFDQDVAGVKLVAGWNTLLLKVHDQTGAWGFRVRLTAADGSPLTGVTYAASKEEAAEALKAKHEGVAVTSVAGGAKQYYDSVAWQTVDGKRTIVAKPQDAFHLGWLHFRRHFDSFSDRQAENLLLKAAESDPNNAVLRFHYAEAAAPPIEMLVEKEENRQRAGREKALEMDPTYAVAYRALAGYYTTSLVNLERAEQLLRKALEVNSEFWQARLDLANVLERRGLKPAAGAERDKALASAKAAGVEDAARVSASQAEKNGMGPAAAEAWREVLKLDATSNDVRRKVAELAAQALDAKGAIGVLDEMVLWNPYDLGARSRKAEILEGAGDLAAAQATLAEALKVAPEDDNLLQALGRVQRKAGLEKESLATYREALRINPKLQALERYVEFLDPEAAPYEDDFHVDIMALVEKAKDYDNKENDGSLTLLDQTVTKVNRDGTASNYTHMAAKILTDQGVKQFDTYYAQGWGSHFKWKLARVLRPSADRKTFTILDAKTNGSMADFPPLEKGDVVDVEHRRDEREQSFFGDYYGEEMFFAAESPMLLSTWTLITPAERTFYFHERNFDLKAVESTRDDAGGKSRVYTWTLVGEPVIAKLRQEPAMPGMREIAPQIQVTTYKDWNEFAKWWYSMIREQYILSDEMRAKVKELVAAKETRIDKIRAIYEFVTGDVQYDAREFGVHGYKPYTATQIFEMKKGDCKDKALLFNTMLKEIGVDGYPVLLFADESRDAEDLSLAMVGHFNHCIAYVPDTDGKGTPMFFDGTAEYASAFQPPAMDQGAQALVVRPEGAEIMTIPRSAPETMGILQKWSVKVREDGGATLKGELVWRGEWAVTLRERFSVEGQRPLMLQQLFAQVFGKLKVVDSQFDDLKDYAKPESSFRVTLDVEKFAKGADADRTLPTAFLDIGGQLVRFFIARPKREQDLVLPSRFRGFRTEADYELPAGWTVVAPPENADIEVDSAGYKSEASADGGKLHLVRDLRLKTERVKVADYPKFREAATKALAVVQQQWKVRKGEAPSTPAVEPGKQPDTVPVKTPPIGEPGKEPQKPQEGGK
jgi:cellulose synthase operon protein C